MEDKRMIGTPVGVSKPIVAKYDLEAGTYSDGFVCGEAQAAGAAPSYTSQNLYGDNKAVEQITRFQNAQVTLNTTKLPLVAASVMFGHTVDQSTKKVTKSADDEANYVGVGYVVTLVANGVYSYEADIIHCCKFQEPAGNFQTIGDSITFATPALTGTAIADKEGDWETDQVFDTEEAALEFIKTKFGMKP